MSYSIWRQQALDLLCNLPTVHQLGLLFSNGRLNQAPNWHFAKVFYLRGYVCYLDPLKHHSNWSFGWLANLKSLQQHRQDYWCVWSYFHVSSSACYYCPYLFGICDNDAGSKIGFGHHNGSWDSSFDQRYFAHFFEKAISSLNFLYLNLASQASSTDSWLLDLPGHVGNYHWFYQLPIEVYQVVSYDSKI